MFQMHSELRSLTAICVVEDVSKCPLGYTPIIRTFDSELDADLWKDGFFGRRVTRYVCVSKSQGKPEHVIQDVQVLHEKELPPEGFSVIQQTTDTNQKAFKKKQLCYKHTHFKQNVESIVDVVILNKLKNPPDGYDHIGDVNGMHFLVRKVSALTRLSNAGPPHLTYSLPGVGGNAGYPSLHDSMNNLNMTNGNGIGGSGHRNSLPSSDQHFLPNSPHAHGQMMMSGQEQAYPYPNSKANYNTQTIAHLTGLEGVPFILRDDLRPGQGPGSVLSPRVQKCSIELKSQLDIDRDYQYDFRVEREALSWQAEAI